jgi:folate-binding protein YgfZ
MSTTPDHPSPSATTDGVTETPAIPPVPLTADEQRGYGALRAGVTWFALPWRWSRIQGAKATDALNGLVTNDVSLLDVNASQYAAALTPKGKMVADMTIVRADEDTFFVAVDAKAVDGWLGLARKYINPRLARTSDESAQWHTWAIYGRDITAAQHALGIGDSGAARIGDVEVRVVPSPTMAGVRGIWLMVPTDHAEAVRAQLVASCGPESGEAVANLVRIEGGRPVMFVDMDENTIPQEANLDALEAISFTKGCYTGQETVARVHFRGHVNKHLRAVTSPVPLTRGTQLVDDGGKVVGEVRSSAISPRLGPIAIGLVRREITPGTTIRARLLISGAAGGEPIEQLTPATVNTLPFPD